MDKDNYRREEGKIKELYREYLSKGYRVVAQPKNNELPNFMRSLKYRPDLIAYGENENFVIEVKTSRSISDANKLTDVADTVRSQKGWDFILVMTNPQQKEFENDKESSFELENAHSHLKEAEALIEVDKQGQFTRAALLIAWAGLEAALRYSLSELYHRDRPLNLTSLIRDSTIYGVISRDDSDTIEAIMRKRNSVTHGYGGLVPTEEDIQKIINIGRRILLETSNQSLLNNKK